MNNIIYNKEIAGQYIIMGGNVRHFVHAIQ